jgi:serine/threonine protein phosphatase PrpC
MHMAWRFQLATEIGGRLEQQDRADLLTARDRRDRLVVLADGMGGQQDGAAAAQMVIDTARRKFASAPITEPKRFLTELCHHAHEAIAELGRQRQTNPASTCTALYLRDNEAYWVHVGDSRLYHFQADGLLYRTRDHTVAELLAGKGAPGPAEPAADPADKRLYMCLGGKNALEPEFGATAVGENDWFMLCSDGFWNQVEAKEVAQALTAASQERETAAELAALAARRGGTGCDNVSVVLAIHGREPQQPGWRRFLGSVMHFGR